MRYGPYLIGMNMTSQLDYELKVPDDVHSALELVSGRPDFGFRFDESRAEIHSRFVSRQVIPTGWLTDVLRCAII